MLSDSQHLEIGQRRKRPESGVRRMEPRRDGGEYLEVTVSFKRGHQQCLFCREAE